MNAMCSGYSMTAGFGPQEMKKLAGNMVLVPLGKQASSCLVSLDDLELARLSGKAHRSRSKRLSGHRVGWPDAIYYSVSCYKPCLFAARLIDLIERAAVGEVRFLRFSPPPENLIYGK